MQISMFSLEAPPAKAFRSQDFAREWLTRGGISPSPILPSLIAIAPNWLVWENVPGVLSSSEGRDFGAFLGGWQNSGMGSPTECLTLSTCEWTALPEQFPSDDGVCSLSDILETGDVPQRYYLSAKACSGILRRADKRGKDWAINSHAGAADADVSNRSHDSGGPVGLGIQEGAAYTLRAGRTQSVGTAWAVRRLTPAGMRAPDRAFPDGLHRHPVSRQTGGGRPALQGARQQPWPSTSCAGSAIASK
jgi:hypothetical protein